MTDAGQRLPAKAERADVSGGELLVRAELGRGEALAHDLQVLLANAGAVVRDLDAAESAIGNHNRDAGAAGIQRVLQELLDGVAWALNDLPGRDSIYHVGIKTANNCGL